MIPRVLSAEPRGCVRQRSRCAHSHSYLFPHAVTTKRRSFSPPSPTHNHFFQRVMIISEYYWSDDFLLPVQFFTSSSNLGFRAEPYPGTGLLCVSSWLRGTFVHGIQMGRQVTATVANDSYLFCIRF